MTDSFDYETARQEIAASQVKLHKGLRALPGIEIPDGLPDDQLMPFFLGHLRENADELWAEGRHDEAYEMVTELNEVATAFAQSAAYVAGEISPPREEVALMFIAMQRFASLLHRVNERSDRIDSLNNLLPVENK